MDSDKQKDIDIKVTIEVLDDLTTPKKETFGQKFIAILLLIWLCLLVLWLVSALLGFGEFALYAFFASLIILLIFLCLADLKRDLVV